MILSNPRSISIIIPVLNEAAYIGSLLDYLAKNSSSKNIKEILVVDGGSTDNTVVLAQSKGVKVISSAKGRAKQMNKGAKVATAKVLYFLHADTYPPKNFDDLILKAVEDNIPTGCFRMKFDTTNTFLHFFAWLTRINHKLCRGGDQSLFVEKSLFNNIHGFNERYIICEDTEFIGRLYQSSNFKVLPYYVITSARKYEQLGTVRLQYHFAIIHIKKLLGYSPDQLYRYYQKNIAL